MDEKRILKNFYVLENKVPRRAKTVFEYGEQMARYDEREVGKTRVKDIMVSTFFIGFNHAMDNDGEPLVFETMAFGGRENHVCGRYSTWKDAEKGHNATVEHVKKIVAAEEEEK